MRARLGKIFDRLVAGKTGQITPASQLGRFLMLAASDTDVTTIVEIGTWNGLGSTLCLQKGLEERRDGSTADFLSLEANLDMHNQARKNLHPPRSVKLLWGTIVEVDALDGSDLSPDEAKWIVEDKDSISAAPLVLDELPLSIDLLLLDGGEFSSWAEFVSLRDRCRKWLFLDDTRVRKNRAVQEWALTAAESPFIPVYQSNNRNGWSVFLNARAVSGTAEK